MIKVHDLKYSRAFAKAIIPSLGRFVGGRYAQSALSVIEVGAQILQGKGSGTGWDLAAEYRAAARYISEGSVVFDVGANMGEWTRAVLPLRPRAVYMFEPQPSCIEKYLRPMESAQCTVVDRALGDREGEIDFYSPHDDAGNASMYDRRDTFCATQRFERSTVRVTTLDAFAGSRKITGIDFLKVDVEGHELSVLRGAQEYMRAGRIRAIAFEFGSADVYSRVFFRDIWDLLTENNYKIFRIVPGGFLVEVDSYYEDLEHFRGVSNYIAAL